MSTSLRLACAFSDGLLYGHFCAKPFPTTIQPGFWRSGNRLSKDKILCRNYGDTWLDMSRMGGNTQKWNAEETFRNDFGNL